MGKISNVARLSDDEFERVVKQSTTVKEVALKIGYAAGRSARWRISERIARQGVDVRHFRNWVQYGAVDTRVLLVKGPTVNNQTIKKRVLADGLLKNICESCGNTGQHNGKRLVLHLDHIDGDNKNNELSNLRMLCPNCHSQTDTYGGKNIVRSRMRPIPP